MLRGTRKHHRIKQQGKLASLPHWEEETAQEKGNSRDRKRERAHRKKATTTMRRKRWERWQRCEQRNDGSNFFQSLFLSCRSYPSMDVPEQSTQWQRGLSLNRTKQIQRTLTCVASEPYKEYLTDLNMPASEPYLAATRRGGGDFFITDYCLRAVSIWTTVNDLMNEKNKRCGYLRS
jgi:hypothetical protein